MKWKHTSPKERDDLASESVKLRAEVRQHSQQRRYGLSHQMHHDVIILNPARDEHAPLVQHGHTVLLIEIGPDNHRRRLQSYLQVS